MKRLMLIAVVVFQPGCSLGTAVVHNICSETKLCTEEVREKRQNRRLADQAWEAKCQCDYERVFSEDYRQGFKDGFADYLEAGGSGLPPTLPPQRYWAVRYQTPEGMQAIDDWYAGFRAGALAAQESGQRELITVPTSRRPVEVMVQPAPPVIHELPAAAPVPVKPPREMPQKMMLPPIGKTPPAPSAAPMAPSVSKNQPTPNAAPMYTPVFPVLSQEVKAVKSSPVTRPATPMMPSEGVVILPATYVEVVDDVRPSPPARLGIPTLQPPPSLDLPRITTTTGR